MVELNAGGRGQITLAVMYVAHLKVETSNQRAVNVVEGNTEGKCPFLTLHFLQLDASRSKLPKEREQGPLALAHQRQWFHCFHALTHSCRLL